MKCTNANGKHRISRHKITKFRTTLEITHMSLPLQLIDFGISYLKNTPMLHPPKVS